MNTKSFSATNPNFWARLVIFALSVAALVGVSLPESPEILADKIVTTLTGGNYYMMLTVLVGSLLMPLWNFIRKKPKLNLAEIFGSSNFVIYLLTFVFSAIAIFGIFIPAGTSEGVVDAIFTKDWIALFTIAITNIADPIVRWFRDRRKE